MCSGSEAGSYLRLIDFVSTEGVGDLEDIFETEGEGLSKRQGRVRFRLHLFVERKAVEWQGLSGRRPACVCV